MNANTRRKQSPLAEQEWFAKPRWPNDAPSLLAVSKVTALEEKFPHTFGKADRPQDYHDLILTDDPVKQAGLQLRFVRDAFQTIAHHLAGTLGLPSIFFELPREELGDLSLEDFVVCPATLRLALAYLFANVTVKPGAFDEDHDDDIPF
jgi:hypothetical protein